MQSPDVVEVRPEGHINWSHHLWRVRGQSLPVSPALSFGGPIRQAGGALALARADAVGRLTALRAAMVWGDSVDKAELEAHVPLEAVSARAGEGRSILTQFFADGHVALTEDFGWDGPMAEALWQARQRAATSVPSVAQAPTPSLTAHDDAAVGVPTGLVVNARGLSLRPALLPEIRDAAGALLYSIRNVHPEALSRYGVARYSHSLDTAGKDERMGAHPAVVRAHATAGTTSHIVVVDARQAAIVRASSPALARAKIIIVLDEIDKRGLP